MASLYWNYKFTAPILIGDTVRLTVKIQSKRETKKPDRGIVVEYVTMLNQRNEVVGEGEHGLMVYRRSTGYNHRDPGALFSHKKHKGHKNSQSSARRSCQSVSHLCLLCLLWPTAVRALGVGAVDRPKEAGMNFELTDAQRMLREMVREFSEKEIKPRAAEIDRTDEFPWDLWKRMAELGLLAMTLPAGVRRLGDGHRELGDRAGGDGAGSRRGGRHPASRHVDAEHDPEERHGRAEAEVPTGAGSGEKIAIIAQTEPGAGSDVAGIQTTARPAQGATC